MKADASLSLAGLMIVASVVAALALPVLNPSLGVIFPASRAGSLLKQCSRETLQGVGEFWTPQVRNIAALERAFPAAFARALGLRGYAQDREQMIGRMPHYARQYGGVVIGSHRYIYVNAFPAGPNGIMARPWRKQPEVVCDGGPDFFGTLYDPASDQFSHFAFNGVA